MTPEATFDGLPSLAGSQWLRLPWSKVYLGAKAESLDSLLPRDVPVSANRVSDFRDYFTKYLLRIVIGWSWVIGSAIGLILLWRSGGIVDAARVLLAAAAAGVIAGGSVGCALIVGDLGLQFIWDQLVSGGSGGTLLLVLWAIAAVVWWACLGFVLGVVLALLGPLGRPMLSPPQLLVSRILRFLRFRQAGAAGFSLT